MGHILTGSTSVPNEGAQAPQTQGRNMNLGQYSSDPCVADGTLSCSIMADTPTPLPCKDAREIPPPLQTALTTPQFSSGPHSCDLTDSGKGQ